MPNLNPPCRDCGTRASQSALAIAKATDTRDRASGLTIREMVGDLPLHFCTVCAMFHGLDLAARGVGARAVAHDMVAR